MEFNLREQKKGEGIDGQLNLRYPIRYLHWLGSASAVPHYAAVVSVFTFA